MLRFDIRFLDLSDLTKKYDSATIEIAKSSAESSIRQCLSRRLVLEKANVHRISVGLGNKSVQYW